MGVNLYTLDRRTVKLLVGSTEHKVGSLRRSWKLTEMDAERGAELEASERAAQSHSSTPAALIVDPVEFDSGHPDRAVVHAYRVIGWEPGRTRVTDWYWDYLPTLGYGVRDQQTGAYVLHEDVGGKLKPISPERARAAELLDAQSNLIQRGQAVIRECRSVRAFVDRFAEADCLLSDGSEHALATEIAGGVLPPASWYRGKKHTKYHLFLP